MPGQSNQRESASADAIRQVIGAEAEVRAKVEACRSELAAALTTEQARVRHIERRTSERLSRLHAHCEQRIEEVAGELRARASADAPRAAPNDSDRQCLQAAVDELARRLIGETIGETDG